MTLLTNPDHATSVGVHALVIGVGKYPFLGSSSPGAPSWRAQLGDLDSPPLSAAAFGNWLQTIMKIDLLPLRSLHVLASLPTQCRAVDGTLMQVDEPTMQNIQTAANQWFDAANAHPENLSIFYFCGHGFTVGEVGALLAQDFGSNPHNPFVHAIDPDGLVSGMLRCLAERQLFIFDACSAQSHDLSAEFGGMTPQPLFAGARRDRLHVVRRSVIRTCRVGADAFGQTNPPRPSVFMEAFLLATRGAGAIQNSLADWVIEPTPLKLGVDYLMKRNLDREEQCVSFGASDSADFPLHQLDIAPVVPVMVSCKPEHRLGSSVLSCSSGDIRSSPVPEPWHLELPLGSYIFQANDINGGVSTSPPQENRPPKLVVAIQC